MKHSQLIGGFSLALLAFSISASASISRDFKCDNNMSLRVETIRGGLRLIAQLSTFNSHKSISATWMHNTGIGDLSSILFVGDEEVTQNIRFAVARAMIVESQGERAAVSYWDDSSSNGNVNKTLCAPNQSLELGEEAALSMLVRPK